MKEMSTYAPKTLLVFAQEYTGHIIPQIEEILSSMELMNGKMYAVVNCSKGKLNFNGIEHCSAVGA